MVAQYTAFSSPEEAEQNLRSLLLPAWGSELPGLNRIDRWTRWDPKPIRLKGTSTWEHRMLRDMGITPWLGLVVTSVGQTLYLEGVEKPGSEGDRSTTSDLWLPWLRSGMPRKQIALHRGALAYGSSYASVRAVESGTNDVQARIDCYSPRESIAVYEDPEADEFPQLFMRKRQLSKAADQLDVWDAFNVWTWRREGGSYEFVQVVPHLGMSPDGEPVCPVVRFTNQMDLEGRTPGEVEPFIPLAARLNKDNYDRLLAQHFNSWKVRTATGLDMTELNQKQRDDKKVELRQNDMLAGGDGVKFGTLPETDLQNFSTAKRDDIEELAGVSQTPVTAFGKMVNVGDAGIEESRAGFYAKRNERRKSFGVSHMMLLRLCSSIEGRYEDAADFTLAPMWEDTDTRTLSQAVDALGKASQLLGVPQQLLWDLIPGINKTTADSWRKYAEEHPNPDDLAATMYRDQLSGGLGDGTDS